MRTGRCHPEVATGPTAATSPSLPQPRQLAHPLVRPRVAGYPATRPARPTVVERSRGGVTTAPCTTTVTRWRRSFAPCSRACAPPFLGVQLITAFLLTLPLYDKFDELVRSERVAYYVAFVTALVSSLLLMAPSSHQRLRSGDGVARRHRRHLRDRGAPHRGGHRRVRRRCRRRSAYLVSSVVLGTPAAVGVTAIVAGGGALELVLRAPGAVPRRPLAGRHPAP